jgi:hypothetical protein
MVLSAPSSMFPKPARTAVQNNVVVDMIPFYPACSFMTKPAQQVFIMHSLHIRLVPEWDPYP